MPLIDTEDVQTKDEVIQEVRKIKDHLAKAFAYDLKKMLDAARMRQKTSDHTILPPPARKNISHGHLAPTSPTDVKVI
jgi:hypothetical protein